MNNRGETYRTIFTKKLHFMLLLFVISFNSCTADKEDTQVITLLDMRYTLAANLDDPQQVKKVWDHLHTIATLQGIVNRDTSRLYIQYIQEGENPIDEYWWNKYRQPGEWLAGRDTMELQDIIEAIRYYKKGIKGLVVYDSNVPSTSNVASAISGIDNLIAVRYDTDPESLYTKIRKELKLPVKVWLVNKDGTSLFTAKGNLPGSDTPTTGSLKNDPYRWFIEKYMKTGKCNTEYAAYYIDQYWRQKPKATVPNHHTLTNHDFFVSKKAFFFDLSPWGDEPATDDTTQPTGTDLETLREMLLLAYKQNKGKKMCYIGGFPSWAFKYTKHAGGIHDDVPTEWEFSRIISAYNAFKDADAIGYGALANASFWQHFPLEKKYKQDWVSREELKQRGFLNEKGEVILKNRDFIVFYVGDYDASSWITQRTPSIWDDPNRGKLPLMWCISPVLQERVPMVLHNFRKTASPNDYFAAADNGAGYLMPGMLQAPRPLSGLPSGLETWAEHCKKYYDKWGLSITGFVIDGEAPGLNEEGLDCYASFSPNGIVPQKIPLTLLHKGMPVIRADYDINDGNPKKAADMITERVSKRPIPFHWFRNILKTPTWYVQVMEEVHKQNPNIELLDAPTFFELYRIYLEQNPAAAEGKID
ncbi:GxGYxYP domain-containing protein [Parabacteroides sp. AM08-6]|uniref:GxGYxYP domain-containing protein n=1 Tax=Parabacteroides sp. AM08-6 TaxID=2292053 RepID=UPI001F3A95ED|nr:GxGYxYP domain-containing protein [Parabacteroides sp. AM08-6]